VQDASRFIGRAPDRLTIPERRALAGNWIALEIYRPETLPLKRIEALAADVPGCVSQLQSRGLDPREFEFVRL